MPGVFHMNPSQLTNPMNLTRLFAIASEAQQIFAGFDLLNGLLLGPLYCLFIKGEPFLDRRIERVRCRVLRRLIFALPGEPVSSMNQGGKIEVLCLAGWIMVTAKHRYQVWREIPEFRNASAHHHMVKTQDHV